MQTLKILLQNRYRGVFILPRSMKLNTLDYHSLSSSPNSKCPICMTPIEVGDEIMVASCHHTFHTQCLT